MAAQNAPSTAVATTPEITASVALNAKFMISITAPTIARARKASPAIESLLEASRMSSLFFWRKWISVPRGRGDQQRRRGDRGRGECGEEEIALERRGLDEPLAEGHREQEREQDLDTGQATRSSCNSSASFAVDALVLVLAWTIAFAHQGRFAKANAFLPGAVLRRYRSTLKPGGFEGLCFLAMVGCPNDLTRTVQTCQNRLRPWPRCPSAPSSPSVLSGPGGCQTRKRHDRGLRVAHGMPTKALLRERTRGQFYRARSPRNVRKRRGQQLRRVSRPPPPLQRSRLLLPASRSLFKGGLPGKRRFHGQS